MRSSCDIGNPIYESYPEPDGGRLDYKARIYTSGEDFVEVPVWVDWEVTAYGTYRVDVHTLGAVPAGAPFLADDLEFAAEQALEAAGIPYRPIKPFHHLDRLSIKRVN